MFDSVEKLSWFLGGSSTRKAIFKNVQSGDSSDINIVLEDEDTSLETSSKSIKEGINNNFMFQNAVPLAGQQE